MNQDTETTPLQRLRDSLDKPLDKDSLDQVSLDSLVLLDKDIKQNKVKLNILCRLVVLLLVFVTLIVLVIYCENRDKDKYKPLIYDITDERYGEGSEGHILYYVEDEYITCEEYNEIDSHGYGIVGPYNWCNDSWRSH